MVMIGNAETQDKKNKFEMGQRYLVKYQSKNELRELIILDITKGALHIKWKRNDSTSYSEWIIKEEFNYEYTIFKKLISSNEGFNIELSKIDPKTITHEYFLMNSDVCPICCGDGTIFDDKNTSGKSQCPKMLG